MKGPGLTPSRYLLQWEGTARFKRADQGFFMRRVQCLMVVSLTVVCHRGWLAVLKQRQNKG